MSDAGRNYIPPWMRYMQRDTGNWGFVIYRCACYRDPDRRARYRAALDRVWDNAWKLWFPSYRSNGVTEEMCHMGTERMDLVWVEDQQLQGKGVDEVRR